MRWSLALARLPGIAKRVKRRGGDARANFDPLRMDLCDCDHSKALEEHYQSRNDRKNIARCELSPLCLAPRNQGSRLPCLKSENFNPARRADSDFPPENYSSNLLLVSRERAMKKNLTSVTLLQLWRPLSIDGTRYRASLAYQPEPPAGGGQSLFRCAYS
jgi:hypothetical protein